MPKPSISLPQTSNMLRVPKLSDSHNNLVFHEVKRQNSTQTKQQKEHDFQLQIHRIDWVGRSLKYHLVN